MVMTNITIPDILIKMVKIVTKQCLTITIILENKGHFPNHEMNLIDKIIIILITRE